ncbi:ECF transporter S component [Microbacterium sp. NPDC089189]|uniref:ECF transporter S component n=1 Tax=Microbacterium sp. NPDC089189 TaxID=3154972 RepID=UPI00342FF9A3
MTTASAPRAPHRISTRTLLTLAAIGVAAGIVIVPTSALAAIVWVAAPPVYGLLVAPYVIPAVLAQALVRRAGSALITGVVAGIIAVPFTGSIGSLSLFVFVAVFVEAPYAATRWRRWGVGMAYVAAGVLAAAYAFFWWITLDAETFPPLVRALTIAMLVAMIFAATAVGRLIASGLRRAGVGRNL